MRNRVVSVMLLLVMLVAALGLTGCGESNDLEGMRDKTADYLMEQVSNPGVEYIGGDWAVYGIACSGVETEEGYFDTYYENVRAELKANDGVIDRGQSTNYARVALALNACGYDVFDVEGYNLMTPQDDVDLVFEQEMNGQAFALISANVCGYDLANEQVYIDYILEKVNTGILDMGIASADYYAFFIQALSFYQGDMDVDAAIQNCLQSLGQLQAEDGSFESSEATSQVIIALCMIDENPYEFVNGENSVVDGLMVYANKDGSFCHLEGDGGNLMATEQALEAMNAILAYEAAHAE